MKNLIEVHHDLIPASYPPDKIRGVTAALDTSLNGRSLDVDTAVVRLTTGPETYMFWSHDPFPFMTRDLKRFATPGNTAFGAWDRSDVVSLEHGEEWLVFVWSPESVTRVGKLDYDVSCTSMLGKLTQIGHKGGIYDSTTQTTAGDLLREICGYVDGHSTIPDLRIFISPEFEDIVLYGWLPYLSPTGENGAETGSARDNLLQVLFAINGYLRDGPLGTLVVENLRTRPVSILDADLVYREGARVIEEQPVTSVTLLEHNYIIGTETETLFEGTAIAGQVIVFREPMANLSATGFAITESGANYAVLSAGTGVMTGTPYVDTTREITRAVSNSGTPNTERIEGATLISLTNSGSVADKLADYYAHRTWIECDAQLDLADSGDVISIYDPFDGVQREACIERISPLEVSGVIKGRISALVGYTPWQTVPFDDVRELLTNSGTWTVPDGVTRLTAVLIGGGSGGKKGENGKQGTVGTGSSSSGGASYSAGKGGEGGAGGAGGAPGRVLRLDLPVVAGQTFSFVCGARGTGGASPTSGTETTFGDYSSINGVLSESGYHDPVTGKRYAIAGKNGLPGGKGGNGGSASSSGYNAGDSGGNVNDYHGGSGGNGSMEDQHDWQPPGQHVESYGGAGGGGASADANGGNATNATHSESYRGDGAGYAGDGADSVTQSWSGTDYGCGGNGGNGGGGGGGAGGYYWNSYSTPVTASFTAHPGAGGAGGAGANGVKGCVILYYRVPRET